jgi:hypothetical protein
MMASGIRVRYMDSVYLMIKKLAKDMKVFGKMDSIAVLYLKFLK